MLTEKIAELKEILHGAKNILIGAGAGLSTAAGYTYDGERFRKYFADFELTAFTTCTAADSILLPRPKSFGLIGAEIFIATVMTFRRMQLIENFWKSFARKITSC